MKYLLPILLLGLVSCSNRIEDTSRWANCFCSPHEGLSLITYLNYSTTITCNDGTKIEAVHDTYTNKCGILEVP